MIAEAGAEKPRRYSLQPDEKVTTVMIYTENHLVWGEVITKEAIRVSTWLRTPSLPQFFYIHDAHLLRFGFASGLKTQAYTSLHLPSSQVIAFHIRPPAMDPRDFDPNEPNRKMEPVTALIGWFRFDGFLRMSTQTNLERYLDVMKEPFTAMYDATITQPLMQTSGAMRVPYVLIRNANAQFSPTSPI